MLIGILGWLIVGLVAGFIASKLANLRNDEPGVGIAIAAGAAVLGGVIFSVISGSEVRPFNGWSLLSATLVGAAAAVAWHVVRGRYTAPVKAKRVW